MNRLFEKIEQYYREREEEFWAMGRGEEAGKGEEREFEFLISGDHPRDLKRSVHMPGYPEYVHVSMCIITTGCLDSIPFATGGTGVCV